MGKGKKAKSGNFWDSLQEQLLQQSLLFATGFAGNNESFEETRNIAKALHHCRHEDDPGIFDQWMNCLLSAVQVYDPLFNEEVEWAWRRRLQPCVKYMKFIYDK